jgi:hypothetical protein
MMATMTAKQVQQLGELHARLWVGTFSETDSYWISAGGTDKGRDAQFRAAFAFALFMGGGMHRGALDAMQRTWVEGILATTPVYGRLLLGSGMSAVPWVNSIERATAYVMQVLIENRHELASSLLLCPFTGRGVPAPHFFLDYRLDDQGNFKRGEPQRFCNPAHPNAYGQRKLRAARKHK